MKYEKRHTDCRKQGHVLVLAGGEWRAGDLGQLPDGTLVQLVHWCRPYQNPTWYWEMMSDEHGYYPEDHITPERLL